MKVFIPELDLTVTCVKSGNGSWAIYPPIWHPSVMIIGGSRLLEVANEEDCIRQLTDFDYACRGPANITAAVHWREDRSSFEEMNQKIHDVLSGDSECCACLNDVKDCTVVFTCHNLHYICTQCARKMVNASCPVCRVSPFIPQ